MCGRYTLTKKQLRFASRFSQEELKIFLKERYNIAPTQDVPLIHVWNGAVATEQVRWGLQPVWAKSPIINAQCEGILQKPTFRECALKRRCLLPADGFYEWQGKTPVHFTLPGGDQFFFAGIADFWDSPANSRIQCCCIVTTAANAVVAPFHRRMPFVLAAADCDAWLDPATSSEELEKIFSRPQGADLQGKPVAKLVPDGEPRTVETKQAELF